MKNYRIILFVFLIICVPLIFSGCKNIEQPLKIIMYDSAGNVFFDSTQDTDKSNCSAYVDIVLEELNRLSFDTTSETINIKTTLDSELQEICSDAYKTSKLGNVPFAAVITGINGEILCAVSEGDREKNFATEKTQPYSAFKPLSVYAPAIEKGTINWASKFSDTPVKQIPNEEGVYEDWPVNGNGVYSEKETSISDSIKLSLNTTAVKCLQETGVSYCIDFLSDKFGIDVSYEKEQVALKGEDEVLHNIGLGYLEKGVSPIDMAGYYQIFATGGNYTEPYSVLEISDGNEKMLYSINIQSKRLIAEETAYIMNALLKSPLERGGTAEAAYMKDVELRGKTGTGTDYAGNWFVCFSPEYSVSIWHGRYMKNICTEIFSDISENLIFDNSKNYPECENVKIRVYCEESGEGFTLNCSSMANGYFTDATVFDKCPLHS